MQSLATLTSTDARPVEVSAFTFVMWFSSSKSTPLCFQFLFWALLDVNLFKIQGIVVTI